MLANCRYFRVFVRREYTRDMRDGHGEFVPAIAHMVTAIPFRSLSFQVTFARGVEAGAMWAQMPIHALTTKPGPVALPPKVVQPWDCPSRNIEVVEMEFHTRGRVSMFRTDTRTWLDGTYLFTVEYFGSFLADDAEQHKQSHVIALDDGQIVAQPNNRLRWHDEAFYASGKSRPPFVPLTPTFCSENPDPFATWEADADAYEARAKKLEGA